MGLEICQSHPRMWKAYECDPKYPYKGCEIEEPHFHFQCCFCMTHQVLTKEYLPDSWKALLEKT